MISNEIKDKIDHGRAGGNRGFSTGSRKLDDIIGGVQRATYYLLGGLPGTGKTAEADHYFVLMPYEEMISNPEGDLKLKVFYRSMEIDRIRKVTKWACHYLYRNFGIIIDTKTILSVNKNRLKDDIYNKIIQSLEYFDRMMDYVHIVDSSINPTGIYMDIKKYMDKNGKTLEEKKIVNGVEIVFHRYIPNNPNEIVISISDHIGLLRPETEALSKKERIDKYSSQCISLRNFYGVSSLAISQFNRDLADMDRRRFTELTPQMEDFKDSGNTAEDAEIVMTIFNPSRYNIAEYGGLNIPRMGGRYRSLSILKNRDGSDMIKFNRNFLGESGYSREFPDPFMEHHYKQAREYTKFE